MKHLPDPNKVKLTHVPGAVLYENVESKCAESRVTYEIGDENVESFCELCLFIFNLGEKQRLSSMDY